MRASSVALMIFLLAFSVNLPLLTNPCRAQSSSSSGKPQVVNTGQWWQISTSTITVLFPVQGQKPMFLWYYNGNSNEVYCVKYSGLIEYLPLNGYYTPDCEANAQNMESLMSSRYSVGMSGMRMSQMRGFLASSYQSWASEFHPSYLPFSACTWHLDGPSQGADSSGNYVSFNLTLSGPPSGFGFAQNNVALRCWFYENQTTENPHGLYSFTVGPGEMRMDFSVSNWSWNTNYMGDFFSTMHSNYGINVPAQTDNLALWCDFASFNMKDLGKALNDANEPLTSVPQNSTLAPTGIIESSSAMTDMIAGGRQIHMQAMSESTATDLGVPTGGAQNYMLQFAEGDRTLPGFFNFVNNVAVVNPTSGQASIGVATASYRTAHNYMQLLVCYPYFGSNILEHDPSLGIDMHAQIIPENVPVFLIAIVITMFVVMTAIMSKREKATRHLIE